MKYLTAILTFCALCAYCNNASIGSTKHKQVSERLSQQELDEIRKYAEQFQFKELDEGIVYPEKPGPLVQKAIRHAAKINEKRHFPYAALFILRLYHENIRRNPQNYRRNWIFSNSIALSTGAHYLEYEFFCMTRPLKSKRDYYETHSGYDWIKKHKLEFLNYPPVIEELNKIEQLLEKLKGQQQEIAAKNPPFNLKKLERFAMEAPVVPNGFAPAPVPEQINRILKELREQHKTDHLPYLLEYGLNLYLKNLTLSRLARVLPVNENLMLSELIRLTKIPKYKTAHEAGWLNRQFHGSFQDINGATSYSSYQIYIWYLENWFSVLDMPNIERLCNIHQQIEKTGMHGVGGGQVCHYGCR